MERMFEAQSGHPIMRVLTIYLIGATVSRDPGIETALPLYLIFRPRCRFLPKFSRNGFKTVNFLPHSQNASTRATKLAAT